MPICRTSCSQSLRKSSAKMGKQHIERTRCGHPPERRKRQSIGKLEREYEQLERADADPSAELPRMHKLSAKQAFNCLFNVASELGLHQR